MFNKFRSFCALVCIAAPALALAAPTVTLEKLSSPPSITDNSVAFLTITSSDDDSITGVSSDCCKAVELHAHEMDGDVMRMRRVESVALKAGVPLKFSRHSYHVMLIGLKKPLKKGDQFAVTFTFAHAAPQTATFTVSGAPLHDAMESPMDHGN